MEENKIFNHKRPVEDFKEQIDKIKSKGFKIIGVSQMYFEDTFIFDEDQERISKAYRLFERDINEKWIGDVVGWWYTKEKFEKEVEEYESKMGCKVLVHWL